jgi:YidC/Oxa1 family membrane protein insertase
VNIFQAIGDFLGTLFGPIGTLFHYVFYEPIYNALMLLYQGVHVLVPAAGFPSIAIAILLLTVAVRLCLYPLTRKQLQSSRAMQALAPQIQELQRKHRNNPQELMAAQQALYREHGVSMYGGCLPLLIQMPFLYGLYFSFYTALLAQSHTVNGHTVHETAAAHVARINRDIYPFLPHLQHLPNTAFLWTNLAAPDPLHILPILAGVLTFLQMRMAQPVRKPLPPGQRPDSQTQTMSSMQYIMPFFTFFIGLNFPAGLAFYWCISTAFSAVQQYFLTGWGSLFLGLEPILARLNLQHLIPEPQSLPTLPSRPAASAQLASRIVDADPQGARPAGLGGFRELLRQLTASTQEAAAERANGAAANGASSDKANSNGTGAGKAGEAKSAADGASADGAKSSAARRTRSERAAPMLVKPPSASAGQNGAGGALASATKSASDRTRPQAAPGTTGTTGAAKTSGGGGTSGAARRPAAGSSGRSGQGGQAGRRRSGGRPKGGK